MTGADYEALWQALPHPALLLDTEGRVREANGAAEAFLGLSRKALSGRCLAGIAGAGGALAGLIARATDCREALAEFAVELAWPEASLCLADITATPVERGVLILIRPRADAERQQETPEPVAAGRSLGDAVELHLERYFQRHGRELPPCGLYDRVRREVDLPLIALTLEATRGNQLRAADLLGINRNTLRKKIHELDIPVTRGKKTSVD